MQNGSLCHYLLALLCLAVQYEQVGAVRLKQSHERLGRVGFGHHFRCRHGGNELNGTFRPSASLASQPIRFLARDDRDHSVLTGLVALGCPRQT